MAAARKSPAAKSLLVAKDGFVCNVKGVEYVVKQAERLASDHAVVKAYPELFERPRKLLLERLLLPEGRPAKCPCPRALS